MPCHVPRAVLDITIMALGVPKPISVVHISLALLGATTTCWTIWLNRNDFIFERKSFFSHVHVTLATTHWLHTWAVLQRPQHQALVLEASQRLGKVATDFFTWIHGWRSSHRIGCY
ncbi:hypothetical protein BS78_08G066900 [Paspalum vaginatum]|nr:hypothetical protein BS78_08G066900 [Paspalum vaginatum]